MGRYGIDYVSVRDAADQMAAADEAVTVEKIRQALGSGSLTTLSRHLRTWRRAQDPGIDRGEAMPEMINDAAQAVWANLSRAAQARIIEAQTAAQTAIQAVQATADEQVAAVQQQQNEAAQAHALAQERLQERYLAMLTQSQQLEAQLQACQAEREQQAIARAEAEAQVTQLKVRIEEGRVQVAQLQAGRAAEQQAATKRQQVSDMLHLEQQEALKRLQDQTADEQKRQNARYMALEQQLHVHKKTVVHLQEQATASSNLRLQLAELQVAQQAMATGVAQDQKQLIDHMQQLGRGLAQQTTLMAKIELATAAEAQRALQDASQSHLQDALSNFGARLAKETMDRLLHGHRIVPRDS